jgi:hypothetical protein
MAEWVTVGGCLLVGVLVVLLMSSDQMTFALGVIRSGDA